MGSSSAITDFARAVGGAASTLARLDREGHAISEKRLVEALVGELNRLGYPVSTGIHLPVPDWDPKPGGTDVVVGDRGGPIALAELKASRAGRQPAIYEALWDVYKLAAQVGRSARRDPILSSVEAAFLVTTAPMDQWEGQPRTSWHLEARELFPARFGDKFEDSSRDLFERNQCAWEDLLWGGRARPSRIGVRISTDFVAAEHCEIHAVPWQIRAARVIACDDEWLEFDGEWPRSRSHGSP